MKTQNITPRPGYVVVKQRAEERMTEGGVKLQENDDDFVVHGEVVQARETSEYGVGTVVVYHVLDGSLGFFDGGEKFAFVDETKVLGTYAGTN